MDIDRFKIKFALHKLPRSVLRDLLGSDEARQRGLDRAADIMEEHLKPRVPVERH
jgi:hypothetical protein